MSTTDQTFAPSSGLMQDVVLRTPESFSPGERSTVSLHLFVKNGEKCLPRLLRNLGPYLDEVVAVLNDCSDGTEDVLVRWCWEQRDCREREGLPPFRWKFFSVTSETHPQFYIMDVPETYAVGRPLDGEDMTVSCTGKPLLARWDLARNIGWREHSTDFILFLDADDEVLDPESIPGLCELMREQGVDLLCTRYAYGFGEDGRVRGESYRERLVRRSPEIAWDCPTHEILRGYRRRAHVDGNLIVVDHKDSPGEGVRVPGRCFKVLYEHARSRGWLVEPRVLLYLGMEVRHVMPEFAVAVLERYLDLSTWPEERAWACSMVGEVRESAGLLSAASSWYERSLSEHPGSRSAYRLCRSRFKEGLWRDAVDAYEIGLCNEATIQLLDHAPIARKATAILAASALEKIDRLPESLAKVDEALGEWPECSELLLLREHVVRRIAEDVGLGAEPDVGGPRS